MKSGISSLMYMEKAPGDGTSIAFVCVENAGRSQMAYGFAKREVKERGLANEVTLLTGGTDPATEIYPAVVEVMEERGIDIADRRPRMIQGDELMEVDIVVTMGCSAEAVCPATWTGESRDWGLPDPDGKDLDDVRDICDAVEERVVELFDELA